MRALRATLFAGTALILGGALAWSGVLPGGWTLRRVLTGREATATWLRDRHAAEREAAFARERPLADAVCFLGSSTIERLPLAELFPGARAVNRGVAGDTVERLRERLGSLLPPAPAGFVLYVGANDLRREERSPERVASDVAALLDELGERAPGAPVVLLGLFRPRASDAHDAQRTARLNTLLAARSADRGALFVPLQASLAGPDGRLSPELADDDRHLADEGSRRLAELLLGTGDVVARRLSDGAEARTPVSR